MTMAKRILQASDLPSWFKLEKYALTEKLSAQGWYEHLLLRKNLLTEVRLASRKRPQIDQPDGAKNIGANSEIQHVLSALRETPLVEISSHAILRDYLYDAGSRSVGKRHPSITAGVRLADVQDLYRAEQLCLDDAERNEARKYFDWLFARNNGAPSLKYQDWFDRPVDDVTDHINGEILVRANMLLPDSMLVDQFKLMLRSLRAQQNPRGISFSSEARKPDLSRWVKYRLLPYIDLAIWESEAGVTIPERLKANVIFPHGQKGDENLRKTIVKAAEDALRWNNLASLSAMIVREQKG